MGLKATMFSDDTPPTAVELCASPDPLPHHGLTINHVPVVEAVDLVRSDFKTFFTRGNRENTVGFEVFRKVDEANRAFRGPVSALKFFVSHTKALPGGGRLRLALEDESDAIVLWLAGCVFTRVVLARNRGTSLDLRYEFAGADIVFDNPNLT